MPDDLGEKTELPTHRRLSEARERGQVARSQDLSSALDLIGAAIIVALLGAFITGSMVGLLRRVLEADGLSPDLSTIGDLIREIALRSAIALAPVLAAMAFIGFLSNFLQVGPLFTIDALRPKFERLDPFAGFARLFGRKNLVKTLLNAVKMAAVLGVGYLVLSDSLGKMVSLPRLELSGALFVIGQEALRITLYLLALLLILGLTDFLFQRWQHTQELRMTKEQVKDERRSMEGDPKVKAARARLARQIAVQRINQAVPEADVVVTNPTHYSVALRYDPLKGGAPRVVAKGVDYLAMRIRQVAANNRVPLVERPPLARALHAGCEVGQEVPPELYQAVAEVLAYVYRLENQAAA